MKYLSVIALFICVLTHPLLASRDYPQIKNGTILTDHGDLLRGCHCHIMTQFYEKYKNISWWQALRDSAHFNVVRMMGYNTPTWYDGKGAEVKTTELGGWLDIAVENSGKAGMYLIIDDHSFCCGNKMNPLDSAKFNRGIAFWDYVAARYAKYPHVIFQLKNEPPDGAISGNPWNEHTKNLYKIVRKYAPNNLVITHTPGAENDNELTGAISKCSTGKDTISYNPNGGRNLVSWHGYGTGNFNESGTDLKGPYVWEAQKKAAVICDEFGDKDHSGAYKLAQFLEARKVSWVWLMSTGFNWKSYPPKWPKDPYAVDMSGSPTDVKNLHSLQNLTQSNNSLRYLKSNIIAMIRSGAINPDSYNIYSLSGKFIDYRSLDNFSSVRYETVLMIKKIVQ